MQKRKDEIRDIYRSGDHDFEKDFTPQVAKEIIESRQRDLRRNRIVSTAAGVVIILLSVTLVAVVVRTVLFERSNPEPVIEDEQAYIPRHTLPADAAWVMDYERAMTETDRGAPGPKPFSTKWVKNAAYHIIMGQQSLALKEPEAALDHFNKVVEIFPEIEGINKAMGMLYLEKDQPAEAAERLEEALKEEETYEVLSSLGIAYMGIEKYEPAEHHLQRALELQPENPDSHKNLAVLYREMNNEDQAIYHFEKYLDLRPTDLNTMQSYALYLTEIGRWKEASAFLNKLTDSVTDVAPIYFLLAQVEIQNGNQQKAIAALQRGVQLIDPDMALDWMNRKEFNTLRDSGSFKTLIDRLEIESVSLDDVQRNK